MSTDRHNDDIVSETYQQLSSEVVPDRLNQTVLDMAATPTSSRNTGLTLASAWMKPAALAATIVLSLTIVTNMPDVRTGDEAASEVPSTTPAAADEQLVRIDREQLRGKNDRNEFANFSPAAVARLEPSEEKRSDGQVQYCGNKLRQSAELWLECIELLRTEGNSAAADDEYRAFALDFPDIAAKLDDK